MARTRRKPLSEPVADTTTSPAEDVSFNPVDFDPELQQHAGAIIHGVAESTRIDADQPDGGFASQHAPASNGHAASVERKPYARPADPFGFESKVAGGNRVQLLKSEGHQAWVIRFAHNPNEDKGPEGESYGKENPHPVLKMLKEEGFRWGFDNGDGKGGWGKRFEGDAYGTDHIEARRVLQKAADMIGHTMDQGRIPD